MAHAEAKNGTQDPKEMLGMQEIRPVRQGRFHGVALDVGGRSGLLESGKR